MTLLIRNYHKSKLQLNRPSNEANSFKKPFQRAHQKIVRLSDKGTVVS